MKYAEYLTPLERQELRDIEAAKDRHHDELRKLRIDHSKLLWKGRDRARALSKPASTEGGRG